MKIHPVFHVSLFEIYHPSKHLTKPQNIEPVIIDGYEEWNVEAILGSRISRNQLEYLVKWEGFPDCENTWEPVSNIKSCKDLINEFHLLNPSKIKKEPVIRS
jgi:hypothetical protein